MKNKYDPYCPVCSGCGEEGCCSPVMCKQSPEGHYCESYLKDLHFGYKMYQWIEENISFKGEDAVRHDEAWDRIYEEVYCSEKDKKEEEK